MNNTAAVIQFYQAGNFMNRVPFCAVYSIKINKSSLYLLDIIDVVKKVWGTKKGVVSSSWEMFPENTSEKEVMFPLAL